MTHKILRLSTVLITVDNQEEFFQHAAKFGIPPENAERALARRVERGERPEWPGARYKVEIQDSLQIQVLCNK